jgi:hypothetical protein
VINREEFNTRFDDLKEYLGERFDRLDAGFADHEGRLRKIEDVPSVTVPSTNRMGWGGLGTGIGAVVVYIGQHIWSRMTGGETP